MSSYKNLPFLKRSCIVTQNAAADRIHNVPPLPYLAPGSYDLTQWAENIHSFQPYGRIGFRHNASVEVKVMMGVRDEWKMHGPLRWLRDDGGM